MPNCQPISDERIEQALARAMRAEGMGTPGEKWYFDALVEVVCLRWGKESGSESEVVTGVLDKYFPEAHVEVPDLEEMERLKRAQRAA